MDNPLPAVRGIRHKCIVAEGKEIEGMNKNGDSATMYRAIPAVAGLNKVEGFDPSSLLGHTVSRSEERRVGKECM